MWRFVRGVILTLLLAVILGVVLRGPLYRTIVNYKVIGIRHTTGRMLPSSFAPGSTRADLEALIDMALDTTSDRLHFSSGKVSNDPAVLENGGAANCIGYSTLFKSLLLRELSKSGNADTYVVEQVIGQLHVGSWNLHSAFNSPFWKDHDIVRITDVTTDAIIYVDPTLHDAVGVGRVSGPVRPAN